MAPDDCTVDTNHRPPAPHGCLAVLFTPPHEVLTHNTFPWMITIEPSPSMTMPEPTSRSISADDRGFLIDHSLELEELLGRIATVVTNEMCKINMTPKVIASRAIHIHLYMTAAEWQRLNSPHSDTTKTQAALSHAIRVKSVKHPSIEVSYGYCKYDADSSNCTFYFTVR